MKKVYASHEKVKCPKCDKEVRKDRLPDHMKAIHGDSSVQLKGQTTLHGFFAKDPTQQGQSQAKTGQSSSTMSSTGSAGPEHEQSASHVTVAALTPREEVEEIMEKDSQEDDETVQREMLDELRDIRLQQSATTRASDTEPIESPSIRDMGPSSSIATTKASASTPIAGPSSSKADDVLGTPQFAIPDPTAFQKLFAGHRKKVPASASSLDDEIDVDSDVMIVDEIKSSGAIAIASTVVPGSSTQTTAMSTQPTKGKSSIIHRIRSAFKRRKLSSNSNSQTLSTSTDTGTRNVVIEEKLDKMQEGIVQVQSAMSDLSKSVRNLSISKSEDDQSLHAAHRGNIEKRVTEAKTVLIRHAKSIREITQYAPEFLAIEAENRLYCQKCLGAGAAGALEYDFALGKEFTDKSAPRHFTNLKTKIVKHLQSKVHIEMSKEKVIESKVQEELLSRNFKVGMVVGLQAYKIIKTGDSYLKFETDIAALSAQGLDVGNINHSRKFCSEFAKSVNQCLMLKVQTIINEPLPATGRVIPISIIADKLTPNRTTMQIVGFHGYVASKFQSLVAGVPALSGCDGLSVTKCIRSGINNLNLGQNDLSKRLVGGAFDGEYFNLKIPSHLSDMMLLDDESKAWYSFQWDPAHILELAEKDSRKSSKHLSTTIKVISNVSKSFSHGKSYRELLEEAEIDSMEVEEELESAHEKRKARVPSHFSDTRFATYSSIVLQKFLNNYEFYYRIMNRQQDDNLDRIDNAHFIFSCGAMADAYEVLGNLSNTLQKPDMPHWEVQATIKVHINCLNRMATELTNISERSKRTTPTATTEPIEIDRKLFPTLGHIYKDTSETGQFRKCPILAKQHTVTSTRKTSERPECQNQDYNQALDSSSKSVQSFIQKFVENFSRRLQTEAERNPILEDVDYLFDVNQMIAREELTDTDEVNASQCLRRYFELAQRVNSLEPEVDFENVKKQYNQLISTVKVLSEEFIYEPSQHKNKPNTSNQVHPSQVDIDCPKRFEQLKLYRRILSTKKLYEGIPDILHLALTGITRTHCEAVVEGMGSVLGLHSQNRTTIDPKTVENETIIRWQGPHPSELSKPLVAASLDHHFKGRENWHFCVSWDRSKSFGRSKVLNRIDDLAKEDNKIPF